MHTEEEARKMWCPMVRHSDGEAPASNRWLMGPTPLEKWGEPDNPVGCRCISSQCMMWRWLDDEFEYLFSPPEQEGWAHAPYYSEGGTKCDRWGRKNQNRKGFCGIGGKP